MRRVETAVNSALLQLRTNFSFVRFTSAWQRVGEKFDPRVPKQAFWQPAICHDFQFEKLERTYVFATRIRDYRFKLIRPITA